MMKLEQLIKCVNEIQVLSLFDYLPPYSVLKSFFKSDMRTMGLDESHTWSPFDLTLAQYEQISAIINLKDLECPEYINDVYRWQAWVYFIKKKVPYSEHLNHILAEKQALVELNNILDSNNQKLISRKHLEYIDVADSAMNFLRPYL